jgi:hypothetical protein
MSENNKNNRINPGHFGWGVLGRDVYDAEQEIAKEIAQVFGPGVLNQQPTTDKLDPAAIERVKGSLDPAGSEPTRGLPNFPVNVAGPGVTAQNPDVGSDASNDDESEQPRERKGRGAK